MPTTRRNSGSSVTVRPKRRGLGKKAEERAWAARSGPVQTTKPSKKRS